jgi:hypothetical protein
MKVEKSLDMTKDNSGIVSRGKRIRSIVDVNLCQSDC